MIKIANLYLDLYSDSFATLLTKCAESIPQWVKDTNMLTSDELDLLSDSEFALCISTRDGEFLRRFPIYDAGHTWMSAHYFIQNKDKLPEQARKIAASNIKRAIEYWSGGDHGIDQWKGIDIDAICKEAECGATASHTYKEQEGDNIPGLKEFEAFAKTAANHYVEKPEDAAIAMEGMLREKTAAEARLEDDDFAVLVKTASGKVAQRSVPITNPGQIKEAEAAFDSHFDEMHPKYRREYAVRLTKAASKHGVKLASANVKTYAAEKIGNMFKEAMKARMDITANDSLVKIAESMIKRAEQTSVETLAGSVAMYDSLAGLEKHWGRLIPDPYVTVLGNTIDKTATDNAISEEGLMELANNPSRLEGYFGNDMLKSFKDNPMEFYNALPRPHQEIMKRFIQ